MKLKPVVDAAAHAALPEAIKGLYTQSGDKFVLAIDGISEHPEVGNLKTALDKERTDRAAAARELATIKGKFGDMDPEEARKALARMQELADKKLIDEGQIEELFRQRTERLTVDHQNQVKQFQKQLEDAKGQYGSLRNDYKKVVIENAIRSAAAGKIRPDLIDAAVLKFTVGGIGGVRWDLDDKNQIVALKGDQIAFGKDATKPMSFDEGFDALKTEAPSFFLGSTGGGASNGPGGPQGGKMFISEADARDPRKYREARAQATEAKVELVIQK